MGCRNSKELEQAAAGGHAHGVVPQAAASALPPETDENNNADAAADAADKNAVKPLTDAEVMEAVAADPENNNSNDMFVPYLGATIPNMACTAFGSAGTSLYSILDEDPSMPWSVLMTHPQDFTPVCTTELAHACQMAERYALWGVRLVGLSCGTEQSHREWARDIMAYRDSAVMRVARHPLDDINEASVASALEMPGPTPEFPFPIITDPDHELVTLLGMLDPFARDARGLPLPARACMVISGDKKIKLSLMYPSTTGRNFVELERVVQSLKLTNNLLLATPVNWSPGDRCIVAPSVPTRVAKEKFDDFEQQDLPSGKKYLRTVKCPA